MRRTPFVLAGTVVGLAAVLSFHTPAQHFTLGTLPKTTVASAPPVATTTVGSAPPTGSTSTTPQSPTTPTTPTTAPVNTVPQTTAPVTSAPVATRSVTGDSVSYTYGTLSVTVTATGSKITKVGIAAIDSGGSSFSESIDNRAIPLLEQEAVKAQSANIQGISGASYTSAGFTRSLQSALTRLGL
jgi:uncharacterized protein with FMN-binding domain